MLFQGRVDGLCCAGPLYPTGFLPASSLSCRERDMKFDHIHGFVCPFSSVSVYLTYFDSAVRCTHISDYYAFLEN